MAGISTYKSLRRSASLRMDVCVGGEFRSVEDDDGDDGEEGRVWLKVDVERRKRRVMWQEGGCFLSAESGGWHRHLWLGSRSRLRVRKVR